MTNEQKTLILQMRKKGLGYIKIGQILNISDNAVRSYCRRNSLNTATNENSKHCLNCGISIKQRKGFKEQKFCSDGCRNKWWNTHLDQVKRRASYHFICKNCGKTFESYDNHNRKYCTHTCYIAHCYGGECDLIDWYIPKGRFAFRKTTLLFLFYLFWVQKGQLLRIVLKLTFIITFSL